MLLCLVGSPRLVLRVELLVAVEEEMLEVDWLGRWLVRWRRGRVRFRIVVSYYPRVVLWFGSWLILCR